MEKTKLILATLCIILCCTTVLAFSSRMIFLFPTHYKIVEQYTYEVAPPNLAVASLTMEIHSTVKQWRWIDGAKYLVYSYSHPAALTTIGENFTAAKQTGHATWNLTGYNYNVTYIALGHQVGLTTSSTVLPGEWNRTSATFEYIGVGHWNYTASFYPGGSGTTNATSVNWDSGIGKDQTMWAYDTFTTITYGAGDQIDVEWEVDIQYS